MNSANINWIKPQNWEEPSEQEKKIVFSLLGKKPLGQFQVVVKDQNGNPQVIQNAPFFDDGTPMPTLYWLVDIELCKQVSKVESNGGVKQAEDAIGMDVIEQIHIRYADQREELISKDYVGPKPTGGAGGTRKGVKCLHIHVANYLATKNDAIGEWTLNEIHKQKDS